MLSLLHVTLVEELIEQQVGPLGAHLIRSQRGTDVASMEGHARNQLLGSLDSFRRRGVNKKFSVLGFLDAKLVQVLLELVSQLLHCCHIGKQDGLN